MPEFTFEIKGVTLNMDEMHKVHKWYGIYSTAEYMLENYPQLTKENVIYLASAVRDLMDYSGYDENEAIYEVFKCHNIKK
jgi:hypothetical protein